jgi:hypothetical protein
MPPPSDAENRRLAFAQTVAVSPIDRPVVKTETGPVSEQEHAASPRDAPMVRPAHHPVDETPLESFDTPQPTTRTVSTGIFRLSSLGALLRAPTRWNRKTWIGVWVALLAGLAVLIAKLPAKRGSESQKQAHATAVAAAEPTRAAPPGALVVPPPSPVPPSPISPSVGAEPTPPVAAAPDPTSAGDGSEENSAPEGFGFLTVHSISPRASVYLMFKRYGFVDEKLVVPCGRRFIGIGLPVRDRKEPTWLAPGKMTDVPCGGSLEVTMNPRRVK